jgi:propionyl-CoA carboxylase alpha chain
MPSVGRLARYQAPGKALAEALELGGRVRVDSGVSEGSEISIYYDPMIAKLVTHAATRDAAIEEMQAALDAFYIRGVSHNMAFLSAVMANARFRKGKLSTDFIADEYPDGFQGSDLPPNKLKTLAAVAAIVQHRHAEREAAISGQLDGHGADPGCDWVVQGGGAQQACHLREVKGGFRVAEAPGARGLMIETDWYIGAPLFHATVEGQPITVQLDRRSPAWRLTHGGASVEFLVLPPHVADMAARMPEKAPPDLSKYLLSPMPGLLVSLAVEPGQVIKTGEELAVVEAMKMENVLKAERDAKVSKILAKPGDSLNVDAVILEFA